MAKWFGTIGFGNTVETKPGIWEDVITECEYYGETSNTVGRPQTIDKVNDNIKINNTLSIVADPFAFQNFHSIKYATYEGIKWKVSAVEVQYPHLILSMGEVYNG